ncbi:hypothetical protein U9M48_033824 [Paspalum notatum var. saurae]|uniref:Uncharacterized protein n=1 Tax=Paspalum notatum var. saurae TaxID=547442 RepID=A0AAQ3X7R9_PASNO
MTPDAAAVENLAISFVVGDCGFFRLAKKLLPRSTRAAQGWIRYAMQNAVKSFVLELVGLPAYRHLAGRVSGEEEEAMMMNLSELPCSAKLKTLRWNLSGVRLQLPASATFTSLVDLSLERIELAAGSAPLLSRLVSSACCPRLQKLKLTKLKLGTLNEIEVLIEAGALLELSCNEIKGDRWNDLSLELRTPSLRVLRMVHCYAQALRISAPRLEELVLEDLPDEIHVDGIMADC